MKILFFRPIIIFFGIFFALVIAFLAFVAKIIFKQKNSAWQGTLIDKKYFSRRDSDNPHRTEHFYTLVFQTTDGKTLKCGVARQIYDQFEIGDKALKEKGKLLPPQTS